MIHQMCARTDDEKNHRGEFVVLVIADGKMENVRACAMTFAALVFLSLVFLVVAFGEAAISDCFAFPFAVAFPFAFAFALPFAFVSSAAGASPSLLSSLQS